MRHFYNCTKSWTLDERLIDTEIFVQKASRKWPVKRARLATRETASSAKKLEPTLTLAVPRSTPATQCPSATLSTVSSPADPVQRTCTAMAKCATRLPPMSPSVPSLTRATPGSSALSSWESKNAATAPRDMRATVSTVSWTGKTICAGFFFYNLQYLKLFQV